MQTCFFCGNANPTVVKQYAEQKVAAILSKQEQMRVEDPVFVLTRNLFEEKQKENALYARQNTITTCMCCHHWIQRRCGLPLPPLPMQNLLWFLLGMQWYDEKKSDKRILLRLAKEIIGSESNV